MTSNLIQRFLFGVVLFCFFAGFSQTTPKNQQFDRPFYQATFLGTEPVVDGEIRNEALWESVPLAPDLIQIKPSFGATVSEKTDIRVAYSATTFYVAVVCYDSEPDKIVVSDSRRDADLNDEDSFLFIIDTYNDQQNGFLFGTNAQGMEYDAQINNEGKGNNNANRQQGGVIGGTNINWDATWSVKTQLGDYGWSAEFAIPLRSLRFASGEAKTWGLNFQRNISKNTEIAYWTSLPLGFDLKRLALAGKLTGLNLKNPGNLKLIPYALVQGINDQSVSPSQQELDAEVGMDVKYSITPSLTLDLTYNTDFAQVEVDDEQVNLDRFNLFFPEKRAFFLENAGQFSVGSPGEVDLFFSRRIGLGQDGSIVPIIGGARVSGKVGQTNVGLLSMFTEDVLSAGITENNFSVARVNHNFGNSRSSLGGIFVNRQGLAGLDDDFNRVYAVDGKWGIGNKAEVNGFFAKSVTPSINGQDHAFKLLANYEWDGWNLNAGYTEVAPGFNPEVGFLQRTAFKKPELLIFKAHRVHGNGSFLEMRPHLSYRGYWNFDNEQVTGFLHVDNHWVWRSGFEIHTGINFTQERVFAPFNISNVTVPVGEYKNEELQFVLITNPNNAFSVSTRTFIGGYFNGMRYSNSGTANFRVGNKFVSSLTMSHNDIQLETGNTTALVGGLRLAYSFTPRIFLQSLIQRNNVSEITSLNARFGWLQSANTGLFVVFNIVRDDNPLDFLDNQTLTIKYTHRFDVLK